MPSRWPAFITGLGFVFLVAAVARAQSSIPLPGHAFTYNGFSLGYEFVANTDFQIAGLALPPEAFQPGDTASYMVLVNGVEAMRSVGNAGGIPVNLVISLGDVVDVFGNWTPAVSSNFTAHNSCMPTTPYTTTVFGDSHVLERVRWDWDIGDSNYQNGGLTGPLSGFTGRIFVAVLPLAGLHPSFTSDVVGGASPLTVNFTDTSITDDPAGVRSWAWDFDANVNPGVDSTVQNPSFMYTACGTYDVALTVTDLSNGARTETKRSRIVTDVLTAGYSHSVVGLGVVQFTDMSTPPATNWSWDFDDDGAIDSTLQHPMHTYPPGAGLVRCRFTASRLCGPVDSVTESLIAAPSIVTTFEGGNGLPVAGNVFGLDVINPSGVTLTRIVMSPWVSIPGPLTLDVYLSEDGSGYANNFANASISRLVATGSATATSTANSSAPLPIEFLLNTRLHIAPGDYTMALHVGDAGVVYTTGNGTNEVHGNSDLTITCGGGATAPFGTSINDPRVWNGALLYDDCAQLGLAAYGYLGNGCPGSLGVSALTATSDPILGGTLSIDIDNLPVDAAIMSLGLSDATSPFGPLPLDLTTFGAPGCLGLVSPDANTLLLGSGGSATYTQPIPNDPAFVCMQIYNQAFVLDPGQDALGGVMSDAGVGILGN